MSSSSSTTPARPEGDASADPSRGRTVLTWLLLGTWGVLVAFGLVSLASPHWLESLSRRGRTTEAHMGRFYGDNAFQKGDFARAVAEYRRAADILPDDVDLQVYLGAAYVNIGDLAQGRDALARAVGLHPTPRLRQVIELYQGDIAAREKRHDEALAHYEQAVGSAIRADLALQRIATLHVENEDFARARDIFAQVLTIKTDLHRPYDDMIDRTRESAESDSAAAAWMRSAGARPLTQTDWARFDTTTIRRQLDHDREIAKTHNHLGFIEYRLGDLPAARRHFERSLQIWPGNQDAARNLRVLDAKLAARPASAS